MDPIFEENVRKAFLKVKEHMNLLEKEISLLKEFIYSQNNQIEFILKEIRRFSLQNKPKMPENRSQMPENRPKTPEVSENDKSSTGNKGVYSDIHSFTIHSTGMHSLNNYSFNYSDESPKKEENKPYFSKNSTIPLKKEDNIGHLNISTLKENINNLFESLSRQEFLTFLIIYQLEDENKYATYTDVAKHLNLTEGCIRTYISSLIKKGLPVIKTKYNNKFVLLSIHPEFRELNLKKQLMNLFYRNDPSQSSLI